MSYTDESSDPEWKKDTKPLRKFAKQEKNSSSSKPKYLQRFCEQWLSIFNPWLTRCEDDHNKPFCRACQCRLDCNRCHLQRHERTSKHARNLEIFLNKGEGAARENFCIRQERSKYYLQSKKIDICNDSASDGEGMDTTENLLEGGEPDREASFNIIQTENASNEHYTDDQLSKQSCISSESRNNFNRNIKNEISSRVISKKPAVHPLKKERAKLFKQIQKDKTDLMDSFKELLGGGNLSYSQPKEKNHVDLFFDSVSFSVKALSPKLIAEAKMRVSQLICELELRALTETENSTVQPNTGDTVIVAAEAENSFILNPQVNQVNSPTQHSLS